MKVLLQKVTSAAVSIGEEKVGQIGPGYLLFLGILKGDTSAQAQLLAEKILKLRLFDSAEGPPVPNGHVRAGKINDRSLLEVNGELLVVSQFTLAGSTEKGNRPDFADAASPEEAEKLYEYFIQKLRESGVSRVETGKFGAMMAVELINDGPVTLMLEK